MGTIPCRFCGRPIKKKYSVYMESAGTTGITVAAVLFASDTSGSDQNLQEIVRDGAGLSSALHQTAHTGDSGMDSDVLALMQAWYDAALQAIIKSKADHPDEWATYTGDVAHDYGRRARELVDSAGG